MDGLAVVGQDVGGDEGRETLYLDILYENIDLKTNRAGGMTQRIRRLLYKSDNIILILRTCRRRWEEF